MASNPNIVLQITHDEALVLFEFFARFAESQKFEMQHNAEHIAFSHIAGQLESALVEPFVPGYRSLLQAAQNRLVDGYEGMAPSVNSQEN